jgi:hypothetical protein
MLRSIAMASLVLLALLTCSGQNLSAHQNKKKPDPPAVAANKILTKLLAAPKDKQLELLLELQNGRGSAYTDALLEAINQLPGDESKEMTRQTLAKRFEKFTPTTLCNYMEEPEREFRLAAVIAIRSKISTAQVEQHVIALLSDSDPIVAAAAMETLRIFKK